MNSMERIKQIWQKLESGNSAVAGLLKLRYSETGKCDVFLGVKIPEMYRMLIVRVPFQIGKEFNLKYEFRGLKFEKIYDQFRPHFVAEHGEPERSFTSVVTFGNNCRRALKEVLSAYGIRIATNGV